MADNVCLPKTHLLIIFLIFIGSAAWYIHKDKKKHQDDPNYKYNNMALDNLKNTIMELQNKIDKNEQTKTITNLSPEDIDRKQFLNQRDREVLYNDFVGPERRQPEHAYPYKYVKNQINIPSRGLPDNYHLIGLLLRNNTESAFNLFGRQTFPGSDQWEYYVGGNLKDTAVKIPIQIRGSREIEDGQTIVVPGSDPSKGPYKVKLYKYDAPRYNPLV
jgi:hypothetical protein